MLDVTSEKGAMAALKEILNLENGIPQAQVSDTPCKEGETDMVKRKKLEITLPNGGKAHITGDTYNDAFWNGVERFGNQMEAPKKSSAPTVREFIENIYKPTYFPTLKPKTEENYEQYLKLNILPFLGDKQLDEVDVSTIQQFYNWMATAADHGRKKNINAKSIERVSGLTSRIFRVAQEMGKIKDTPFKKTLLKKPCRECRTP